MKIKSSRKKFLFLGPELRKKNRFRVAIFGSARIKPGDKQYTQVFGLAKMLGAGGFDVVTGGGPGLMQAANQGHNEGDVSQKADSIGLIINLPWENKGNPYLELFKKFDHFSNRLDTFMKLSHAMVVTQGGIGTILELFYIWQHLQVKHLEFRPIILIGSMWESLINWLKKHPLVDGMMSKEDFDFIYIVKNNQEAMKLLEDFRKMYEANGWMSRSQFERPDMTKKVIATKTQKSVRKVKISIEKPEKPKFKKSPIKLSVVDIVTKKTKTVKKPKKSIKTLSKKKAKK